MKKEIQKNKEWIEADRHICNLILEQKFERVWEGKNGAEYMIYPVLNGNFQVVFLNNFDTDIVKVIQIIQNKENISFLFAFLKT